MYDGELLVYETWADGLRPDPDMTASQWAEEFRVVSADSGSPYPGRWDPARVPYTKEVQDCLSPAHPCRKVATKKGAQLAFSECGVNLFGLVAHQAPAPMVILLPTQEEANKYNTFKLDPTIRDTPELKRRVAEQRSRKEKGSTTKLKKFPGGYAQLSFASTSSALQMISAKYLIYEECSEYPDDAGGRGHPIDQARSRSDAWAEERKEYFCSTPGTKGRCRVTQEYDSCAVRLRLYVRCPHCGWHTTYAFDRLHYNRKRPFQAWVECANPSCKGRIEHHHKKAAYADFAYAWVPLADEDGVLYEDALDPETTALARFDPWSPQGLACDSVGFAASQLYSPFKSFDDVADQLIQADEDPKKAKAVCQQVKGEPFDEGGAAPPWQDLLLRRERYEPGRLPAGAYMLTGGADVQGDRIEAEVVAWGPRGQTWSVDYRVFLGNTTQPQVWKELDEWVQTTYADVKGRRWPMDLIAIDNGYRTKEVNQWVARHPGRAMVIKGDSGATDAPYVRKGSKLFTTVSGRKVGLDQWIAGTYPLTRDTYDYLSLVRGEDGEFPACYCHFPENYVTRPVDEAHFKQLVAEELKIRKDGSRYFECPNGVRNEVLDCRKYATAAAYRLGIPYFTEDAWMALALKRGFVGEEEESSDLPLFQAAPSAPQPSPAPANGVRDSAPPSTPPPPPPTPRPQGLGSMLAQLNR